MKRRSFLKTLGMGALSLALPAVSWPEKTKKPNVLFIAADDLRGALGCLGDKIAVTPNMDKLAGEGTVFLNAYCQQAVCNPSRASVITGLRPDTLKVWDLKMHFRKHHPEIVTLPQYFKQHGYYTQSFGKVLHTSPKILTIESIKIQALRAGLNLLSANILISRTSAGSRLRQENK